MEHVEVIEGNKLISEFMGKKPIPTGIRVIHNYGEQVEDIYYEFEYHTSWNWLMAVVEKIKKEYDFSIQFMNNECNVFVSKQTFTNDEIFSIGGYDEAKEAVWDAVVRFIKWYNKNKK